jgi:hypothetical protein
VQINKVVPSTLSFHCTWDSTQNIFHERPLFEVLSANAIGLLAGGCDLRSDRIDRRLVKDETCITCCLFVCLDPSNMVYHVYSPPRMEICKVWANLNYRSASDYFNHRSILVRLQHCIRDVPNEQQDELVTWVEGGFALPLTRLQPEVEVVLKTQGLLEDPSWICDLHHDVRSIEDSLLGRFANTVSGVDSMESVLSEPHNKLTNTRI